MLMGMIISRRDKVVDKVSVIVRLTKSTNSSLHFPFKVFIWYVLIEICYQATACLIKQLQKYSPFAALSKEEKTVEAVFVEAKR